MYYGSIISVLKRDLKEKERLQSKVSTTRNALVEAQRRYVDLLQAQMLLATVSDDNTDSTLLFVSGVINKALAEIFKNDTRRIHLAKKLYADTKPHIVIELENGKGERRDLTVQSGTGLRQIISVLFVICLIEVRKSRRLVIFDERMSGLHKEAKRIMSEILKIFAEGGFQFVFVEYSLNDLGRLYSVEKPDSKAKVYPLDGEEYNDEDVFLFSDIDLGILDKDYSEEF